jgi:23S rRNA G2445 N2-methylase RlmL
MEALLLTLKGGEDVALKEIDELIGVKGKKSEGAVSFSCENYEDLFKLAYFSQSAHRLLLKDYESLLTKERTFRVRSQNHEEERAFGEKIAKRGFRVDLDNPDCSLSVHEGELYLDFAGDLSRRSFRIFTHRHTLKGTTAYILLRESGYTGKESLLDPLSKDGTIVLEAAHFASGRSVRFFDRDKFYFLRLFPDFDFSSFFDSFKERTPVKPIYACSPEVPDITALKKNAKIAGIKCLEYSRKSLDWLDTKFKKKEIDLIVSFPPHLSEKSSKELYHQASYIAKKTVLFVDSDFKCDSSEIAVEKEKLIWTGKEQKKIVWLS